MDLFTHAWFRKIMHWSWVKQSSKSWQIVQYKKKKSHLSHRYQSHLKRPQLLGSCQAYDAGYRFSTSLIFTWKLKLYHGQSTISCLSWSDKLSLFIFKKISAKYPRLNDHSLSIICFVSNKSIPWKDQVQGPWAHSSAWLHTRRSQAMEADSDLVSCMAFLLTPFSFCCLIPLWITRRKWKDPTLTLDGMEKIFKCFPLNNCVLHVWVALGGYINMFL